MNSSLYQGSFSKPAVYLAKAVEGGNAELIGAESKNGATSLVGG